LLPGLLRLAVHIPQQPGQRGRTAPEHDDSIARYVDCSLKSSLHAQRRCPFLPNLPPPSGFDAPLPHPPRPTLTPIDTTASMDNANNAPEGSSSSSSRSSKAASVDRHGFLQRLGVAAAAGVLGSSSGSSSSTTGPLSLPPAAMAIGELAEWAPDQRFTQHLVVNVPDMAAALSFYLDGLQMKVLRSRIVDGQNSTFVGFGPETLTMPGDWYPGVSAFGSYGAHFALELNEVPKAGEVSEVKQGGLGGREGGREGWAEEEGRMVCVRLYGYMAWRKERGSNETMSGRVIKKRARRRNDATPTSPFITPSLPPSLPSSPRAATPPSSTQAPPSPTSNSLCLPSA
jgi:hypothetical protein